MKSTNLQNLKQEFIEFLVTAGAIRFGTFRTKSGRETPYFINIGNIDNGPEIKQLGEYYARLIQAQFKETVDNLFGPAYKGIPLVVAATQAYYELFGRALSFTFNRKEIKDHGEQGMFVGHTYKDGESVVIVEDVMTAGTSIHESIPMLKHAANVNIEGVVIAVDREEMGPSGKSAIGEIEAAYGIRVFAIVSIHEIVDYLRSTRVKGAGVIDDDVYGRILIYRKTYGTGV